MPLNPELLKKSLKNKWLEGQYGTSIEAANAFMECYSEYARGATCGGLPVSNQAAIDAGHLAGVPLIILANNSMASPVWALNVATGFTAFWNAAAALFPFGPTIVAPAVALPPVLATALTAVTVAGMAGAEKDIIANLAGGAMDVWTRTIVLSNITTGTPVPTPLM